MLRGMGTRGRRGDGAALRRHRGARRRPVYAWGTTLALVVACAKGGGGDRPGVGDGGMPNDGAARDGAGPDDAAPRRDGSVCLPRGTEVCDPAHVDEDCDPTTIGELDSDEDGYGSAACCNAQPDGTMSCGPDCDDDDPYANPMGVEICNLLDDNCDGTVDEAGPMVCALVQATGTCVDGRCRIVGCEEGFDNCDLMVDNGCEQSLDTLDHCGACDAPCAPPNALPFCAGGACAIESCEEGFDDCDGFVANGCEQSLRTVENCAGCGLACTRDHATTTCSTGTCAIAACGPGFDDCDGIDENGCEQAMNTQNHCGACNRPCALDNAGESCSTGTCLITSCAAGYCDGNASPGDGCEHDLDENPSCDSLPVIDMGAVRGDAGGDVQTAMGHSERWYRVRINEANSSLTCYDLGARIELTPAPGTDYDLRVYCDGCTSLAASSSASGSAVDAVHVRWDESCSLGVATGSNSGRYVHILVKYWSANTCAPYSLTVAGNIISGANTCPAK